MKNLLLTSIFLITALCTFAAEKPKGDDPYMEAAKQMCDCVNQSLGFLSERMVNIIVDADGDDAILETELEKYAEENLDGMLADLEMLEGSMLDDMTSCFDRVAGDFDDVYTDDSDEEVETKIIEAMAKQEGCENSVAFFRLGVSSSDESDESIHDDSKIEPLEVIDGEEEVVIMSFEICDCMSNATELFSPRMKEIFMEANGSAKALEDLVAEYSEEDSEAVLKDLELMQGSVGDDVDNCISRIESDYEHLYEVNSREDVEAEVISILEDLDDCEVTAAMLKLARVL